MSQRSLTIVLPVYNAESRLTDEAQHVLELASDLTPQFSVLIVDDGSTDDTAVVAHELTSRFPQVALQRNRQRMGLGSIIEMTRRHVASDVVVVHDGVTPIDASQLRRLWQRSADGHSNGNNFTPDVSELSHVRATHDAMSKAHDRLFGFLLVDPAPAIASGEVAVTHKPHRASPAKHGDRKGVGQIPPLPRPNFLSAVADFALGE